MNKKLYFVSNEIAEEYKSSSKDKDKGTVTPLIIRRKLSAMIYTSMYNREHLGNGLYYHRFGRVGIYVEEEKKMVTGINLIIDKCEISSSDGKFYHYLCNFYGLNGNRTGFRDNRRIYHERKR